MTSVDLDAQGLADEELTGIIARREESARAGQDAHNAFDRLYLRHARRLLAFLAARVHRNHLDDVHQEVWQRVWKHLLGGFHGGNFRAWLYQIARNCAIDWGRRKWPELLEPETPVSARATDAPTFALAHRERQEVLEGCLGRLDPSMAALVRDRLAGEDYDVISRRQGLRPERAHKLFHKAKELLRTCVERALA